MTVHDSRSTLEVPSLAVGDAITPMVIAVTATRIVAGAIASRDFMPAHHDPDFARAQGAPDIFMNILSDTALCSRFLTDWAGPEVMVARLAIRLGVPVLPGHTLTFTGEVTALGPEDDGVVEVGLRAVSDLGDHVTGTAELHFPRR